MGKKNVYFQYLINNTLYRKTINRKEKEIYRYYVTRMLLVPSGSRRYINCLNTLGCDYKLRMIKMVQVEFQVENLNYPYLKKILHQLFNLVNYT